MTMTLTVAPVEEPVTLTELKDRLRIDTADDDAALAASIVAARERVEVFTRRVLVTATYELRLDAFPAWTLVVPRPPLQSVTKIEYIDTGGTLVTLAASGYTVDAKSAPGRIVPAYGTTWPATRDQVNAVIVTLKAGYGLREAVPRPLTDALVLLVRALYDKGRATEDTAAAEALMWPYRAWAAA